MTKASADNMLRQRTGRGVWHWADDRFERQTGHLVESFGRKDNDQKLDVVRANIGLNATAVVVDHHTMDHQHADHRRGPESGAYSEPLVTLGENRK